MAAAKSSRSAEENGSSPSERLGGRRITRLRLANWRNFTRVDVELQRRSFIVGPNAAGKSNLLDSLRFLHEIVAVGGGLQEAIRSRDGVSKIRSLSARRPSTVEVSIEVGGEGSGPPEWTYELQFSQDAQRRASVKTEIVKHNDKVLLKRPDESDKTDAALLSQTHLEQVNVNREFRGLADFLREIRYLHIVPQLVREPDRSVGREDDPFGGDFLHQIARTQDNVRNARLRRILEALRVAVPQLQSLRLDKDEVRGTPHLVGVYDHWRPHGAKQDETQFSDGTLRLLGLLWAVLDGRGPLLLEEPELSLHPAVVRHIPSLFASVQRKRGGRQIIVSTHSRDLLAEEGIGLNEVLILEPGVEGTQVKLAAEYPDIARLVDGGISLSDVLVPRTSPPGVEQLALFHA
jgi:predicted ATPase